MNILGIGNAIVDVICKVDDEFLSKNNLAKSNMKLIDETEFRKLLGNLKIEETISGYNASVVINLFGENLDLIDQDSALISSTLNTINGIKDITLQSPPGSPEVFIKLRSEKMSSLGINKADVFYLHTFIKDYFFVQR